MLYLGIAVMTFKSIIDTKQLIGILYRDQSQAAFSSGNLEWKRTMINRFAVVIGVYFIYEVSLNGFIPQFMGSNEDSNPVTLLSSQLVDFATILSLLVIFRPWEFPGVFEDITLFLHYFVRDNNEQGLGLLRDFLRPKPAKVHKVNINFEDLKTGKSDYKEGIRDFDANEAVVILDPYDSRDFRVRNSNLLIKF